VPVSNNYNNYRSTILFIWLHNIKDLVIYEISNGLVFIIYRSWCGGADGGDWTKIQP
jgi:hypothetical protein